jgi:hypothetical protein
MVAEVAPHLPHHGGNSETKETRTLLGIEAVNRVEQPEACHLYQILEILTTSIKMTRDIVGQRQAPGHDLLAAAEVCAAVRG